MPTIPYTQTQQTQEALYAAALQDGPALVCPLNPPGLLTQALAALRFKGL